MAAPAPPPFFRVFETPTGVRYHLFQSRGCAPSLALLPLVAPMAAVPLAGAVLAVLLLANHFQAIPWPLLALSCLFVAQMLFLARLPGGYSLILLRRALVGALGHGELEVRGSRLRLGAGIGPLRWGDWRPVEEFRRVVVWVYPLRTRAGAAESPQVQEDVVLAIECDKTPPWLLTGGFPQPLTLALAEDLNRRLEVAGAGLTPGKKFPPVEVVETTQDTVYPKDETSRRRWPWWLAWTLAGMVGLGALTAGAHQAAGAGPLPLGGWLFVAWLLEFFFLAVTISFAREALKKGRGKAEPPAAPPADPR